MLLQRFRQVAILEAVSWTGLLIGMVFKYLVVKNQIGVQVFGPVHGVVFIAYVISALLVARRVHWSGGVTLVALAASIPPFGSVVFLRWANRQGELVSDAAAGRAP